MSRNICTLVYLLLILILAPLFGLAQTTQTSPSQQLKQTTTFDFEKQSEISRKELSWGKMYLNSYQRTGEIKYLSLAAKHCFNSIKSYHLTQISLKKRTRFTYQTKSERLNACSYYEKIYNTARHLKEQYHLLPVNPIYCTHSVTN